MELVALACCPYFFASQKAICGGRIKKKRWGLSEVRDWLYLAVADLGFQCHWESPVKFCSSMRPEISF